MNRKLHASLNQNPGDTSGFDLDYLLHPAHAFEHPFAVVNDPDLTLNEKRAILASWASDACAVEAMPELRQVSSRPPVKYDDIMDGLRQLDRELEQASPHYRRVLRKGRYRRLLQSKKNNRGQPLQ
jgi:hypothetical protein